MSCLPCPFAKQTKHFTTAHTHSKRAAAVSAHLTSSSPPQRFTQLNLHVVLKEEASLSIDILKVAIPHADTVDIALQFHVLVLIHHDRGQLINLVLELTPHQQKLVVGQGAIRCGISHPSWVPYPWDEPLRCCQTLAAREKPNRTT